ncbi:RNA binding motif protein 12Ba [Boleophthalmus pectinirostris]|uniref:RNA binding motif protein 12Ba n=1 Tax=Boleophthalmus pectinirostris TaxID=150288 RepID=UPI000A1C3B80|nr:RNA binding motif protein 12Ba [Boleophthalmus pectinirostris]
MIPRFNTHVISKMSTILQLRGLDTKANAEDIRGFFGAIHIPDGGVFITGGALGEAFIAFNSEEDGILAMQQSGHFLKDSKVDLQISSMVELEHKVDTFLNRKKSKHRANKSPRNFSSDGALPVPDKPVNPRSDYGSPSDITRLDTGAEQTINKDTPDSKNTFLLRICTLLQGLASSQGKNDPCDSSAEPPLYSPPNPGFIRVFGLPSTTTKQDICNFFQGLSVKEVLVNVKLGVNHGCMVKFETFQEATEALNFNQSSACVEVRTATEKMWINALQEHEDGDHEGVTLEQGPLKDTVNYSKVSKWPRKKRNTDSMQKPPKKLKNCQSDNIEYIIMVSHLPVSIVKTEIKELFGCPNIAHSNVLHLLDSEGQRTDKVFVKFDKEEDYDYAVNLNGCHVGSSVIEVSPITKEEMTKMIKSQRKPKQNTQARKPHQNGKMDNKDMQSHEVDVNERRCLYVRNMPANVQRSQIKGLFTENKLKEEDITLLHDSDGICIGEAVIQFQSQTNAALALMHHGREFLGSKILLTPISVKQMQSILLNY